MRNNMRKAHDLEKLTREAHDFEKKIINNLKKLF